MQPEAPPRRKRSSKEEAKRRPRRHDGSRIQELYVRPGRASRSRRCVPRLLLCVEDALLAECPRVARPLVHAAQVVGTAAVEAVQNPAVRAALAAGLRELDDAFEDRMRRAREEGAPENRVRPWRRSPPPESMRSVAALVAPGVDRAHDAPGHGLAPISRGWYESQRCRRARRPENRTHHSWRRIPTSSASGVLARLSLALDGRRPCCDTRALCQDC
jgi:Arc/MetJ family transcription regulator